MTTSEPIRVGVVGLHFGAQVQVPAFRADPRCVVSALAGRDARRTASVAEDLGIPVAYGDWHALLAEGRIDAVAIAVPPAEQPAIIEEAARLGKHVFCEKPLASSVSAAEHALASVQRAGVIHAVDFIFPEIPAWQLTRRLLGERAIGPIHHFSYTWRTQTLASRAKTDSWKNRPRDGGGAVGTFLSHVVFNLEWLLGEIACIESVPRRAAASAFVDGVAHLADGVHGSIAISTDAYLGGGHHIEVFGESGTLVLRNSTPDYADGFEVSVGTRENGRLALVGHDAPGGVADGRIAPVGRIVKRFVDAIRGEGEGIVTPNLEDGLRVQRWLQRINDAHTH